MENFRKEARKKQEQESQFVIPSVHFKALIPN